LIIADIRAYSSNVYSPPSCSSSRDGSSYIGKTQAFVPDCCKRQPKG
jgi:hypothetical protein